MAGPVGPLWHEGHLQPRPGVFKLELLYLAATGWDIIQRNERKGVEETMRTILQQLPPL